MKLLLTLLALIFTLPAWAGRHNDDYHWVVFRGAIPAHAVAGGAENGRPLYICHANYMGAIMPGKMVDGTCNVTYAGREAQIAAFQILVGGGDLHWEPVNSGMIPYNAVAGGNRAGRPIYVCQVEFAGGVHPGKVVGKKCNIGYGGNEIENARFRVLVLGNANPTPSQGGYYTSQEPQNNSGYSTSQDNMGSPGYTTSQDVPAQGGYH